jgi:hypothetical protein
MKRNYTRPTFFTRSGLLFAEFPDGTLYGVHHGTFYRITVHV